MNQYQIAWTNTENSVTGCGKKLFSEDEARALCAELNRDYPHIEHVPKLADEAPDAQPEKPLPAPLPFTPLTDDSPMPFGKHKGEPMRNLPSHYLDYLRGLSFLPTAWPQVNDYITRSLKAINQDLERSSR